MPGNLLGVTSLTGLQVGGGSAQAASANGNVPASTVSGGVYPTGTAMYAHSYSIVTTAAITLTGNKSSATSFRLSGCTPGDWVALLPPASGLSDGITADCWIASADFLTIQFSNVSSASAAQIATGFKVQLIKVVP